MDEYIKELTFDDCRPHAGQPRVVDMSCPIIREKVEIFGKLCATQKEMADFFGCTQRTIEKYMAEKEEEPLEDSESERTEEYGEFRKVYTRAAAEGKTSLRRVQMNKAMNGDTSMCIWLGKQLLDQKDKMEEKIDTTMRTLIIDIEDANL